MAKPKKKFAQLREELAEMRQRLFERLATLATSDLDPKDESEEAHLRRKLWACVRELDTLLEDVLSDESPEIDLSSSDPAVQQFLYEFVAKDYFRPHLFDDPGDVFIPTYTPEEAGLRVYFEYGRWFVTWMKLEEDTNRPEAERRELLVFEWSDDEDLHLREV